MNVALLTYEFGNPDAVASGCPKDWPYSIYDMGEATELPPPLRPPWKVISRAELNAQMEALTEAKEAWNNRETTEVALRRQQATKIKEELQKLRDGQGRLTLDDATTGLRHIAMMLLIMLEEEKLSLR